MRTPEDWARIRALFHDALERTPEERAAFVQHATGSDTAARREVESLLAAHSRAGGFLSRPPTEDADGGGLPRAGRLSPGTRLGAFEIVELLGAGGMGEVYRALDTRLDRAVAIKVLPPETAGDPRSRDRFEREARVISRLSHSHICTLYDVGSAAVDGAGDAVRFLVMELLEGETLAARLAKGPMSVGLALKVSLEILEALAAAHAVGIVHRDLKPANIMLTKSGAKLLDFGLARLRLTGIGAAPLKPPIDDTLSATGLIVGTVPYMAPEQVRGEETDARTDLFAFGAVFYEMLTGRRAFSAASEPALIAAILEQDPAPVTSLQPLAPRALQDLVHACLAKDRAERWQHAQDVLLSLRSIAEGRVPTDSVAPPPKFGFLRRNGPFASILPGLPHLGWAIVAVVVGLSAWALGRSSQAPVPAANPRPVVVLMDSPLEGRVYDPRTRAAGGTNADDVSDALRDLAIVISKENTSPIWHREEQVIQQNPDLVVSHLSCLYDQRFASYDTPLGQHLFDNAQQRLLGFFGYVASNNPRTKFLIYSRGRPWPTADAEASWRNDVLARFPKLKNRLFTLVVPGRSGATFRDPRTAQLIRTRVSTILGLADP
jgi:serine/threonine protein kinase